MKVRIAPQARSDIEAIGDRIATDSESRAASFVEELYLACSALSEHPERYAIVPRYRTRGIRSRSHGRYLIFYRIDEDGVGILRVVHGARDLGQIFADADL